MKIRMYGIYYVSEYFITCIGFLNISYMRILVKILFLSIQYSKGLTSGAPKTARNLVNETFIIIIKVM